MLWGLSFLQPVSREEAMHSSKATRVKQCKHDVFAEKMQCTVPKPHVFQRNVFTAEFMQHQILNRHLRQHLRGGAVREREPMRPKTEAKRGAIQQTPEENNSMLSRCRFPLISLAWSRRKALAPCTAHPTKNNLI